MDLMTFGRHRGDPACDVPLRYLVWAMESMACPPPCVINELRRRAASYGSRDSINAQAALSGHGVKSHRKAKRKASKARRVKAGGEAVGKDFQAERAQWVAAGGDPASCPWGD
jgi:hypothetical protein